MALGIGLVGGGDRVKMGERGLKGDRCFVVFLPEFEDVMQPLGKFPLQR
ncbi:hypothetical protein QUB52_18800 [Microcoleus sp. A6-C6]